MFIFLQLLLLFHGDLVECLKVGINYGQIGNNLPEPSEVVALLESLGINRVKLYDSDPRVLKAFANTDVEFIIGISNEDVQNMKDASTAEAWVIQHVEDHLSSGTRITSVTVGNEVLSGEDGVLMHDLVPAMQTVYGALVKLGLDKKVQVTTAHSVSILETSYPPTDGAFRQDIAGKYIDPLLKFHSKTGSSFLINVYPFFAYKDDPTSVSLDYVLFKPDKGITDPNSNLHYDNMLFAQIDSVHSAIERMGYKDIVVVVSETGWPSKGDSDETGASLENAATYNRNLIQKIGTNDAVGTPMKPSAPIDVYLFALFNENMKPGPTSERNYGLFYPDRTPVYELPNDQKYTDNILPYEYYSSSSPSSPSVDWFSATMVAVSIPLLFLLLAVAVRDVALN